MLTYSMATIIRLGVLLLLYDCAMSLIVPEELPTVLSLIYSNIPPIKKGTDSRIGVGFRLGEHADFQILLELGPQTRTDPIGNVDDSTKRRREAMLSAAMRGELGSWAQAVAKYQTQLRIEKELEETRRLREKLKKLRREEEEKENKKLQNGENTEGNDWLKKWSKGMVPSPEEQEYSERLPIQDILPNIVENKVSLQAIKVSDNVSNKMEELTKLYKPQLSVQSA